MKKVVFLAMFAMVTAGLFADQVLNVYTSEGTYQVAIGYVGMNIGRTGIDNLRRDYPVVEKLSNGQWECVRRALSLYQTAKGETYAILINPARYRSPLTVVCEFTSATQYIWWAFQGGL